MNRRCSPERNLIRTKSLSCIFSTSVPNVPAARKNCAPLPGSNSILCISDL